MCLQASATACRLKEAAAQADQAHSARQQQLQEEIQQLQAAAAHGLSSHSTQLQELQQQCAAVQAAHQQESCRADAAEAELAACKQQLGSAQSHVQLLQHELGQVKQQLQDTTSAGDR
jgi:chromosome segregation ATPase